MRIATLASLLLACGGGTRSASLAPPPDRSESTVLEHVPADALELHVDAIAAGKLVFENKGCIACHTVDGAPRIGVTMAGLWGTMVELVDASKHLVDAAFIERALREPQTYRRPAYPPTMPSYEGQLRAEEVAWLTAYIESLAGVTPQPPDTGE